MTDERTTITRDDAGNSHSTTTIVSDDRRSGGSGMWLIGILVLAALGAIAYFVAQGTAAETAKDNAIGDAAAQVGSAAEQVGETVENVGNSVADE